MQTVTQYLRNVPIHALEYRELNKLLLKKPDQAPMTPEHLLGDVRQCYPSMRLGHLHDIEKECHHATLVFKVHSPRNQRTMVGRCPCISPQVNTPWVIPKQRTDALAELCIYNLDITSYGVRRWDYQVWPSSCARISESRFLNHLRRAIGFCHPCRNVGADIDLCQVKRNRQISSTTYRKSRSVRKRPEFSTGPCP